MLAGHGPSLACNFNAERGKVLKQRHRQSPEMGRSLGEDQVVARGSHRTGCRFRTSALGRRSYRFLRGGADRGELTACLRFVAVGCGCLATIPRTKRNTQLDRHAVMV